METITRKPTSQIMVRNVPIGGGAPISVQSMTNTKTADIKATLEQIRHLEEAGCQIVRLSVPDEEAAEALKSIRENTNLPLVADIHFNYRLALKAINAGMDKIRINPGNIGSRERVKKVLQAAESAGIPIRIGINAGSLEKDILEKYGYPTPEGMLESAERHISICRDFGFEQIAISLKSSDVPMMIKANRLFSEKYDYPLHIGVTEAGPVRAGIVKSSVGIGTLLVDGIGDTIRVSLTDDPVQEVKAGYEILKSLNLATRGITIVSCPTCGRMEVDLIPIVREFEEKSAFIEKSLKVAIMGCAVNGPGEARDADLGVACGKHAALLFVRGKTIGKIKESDIVPRLLKEIENWEN